MESKVSCVAIFMKVDIQMLYTENWIGDLEQARKLGRRDSYLRNLKTLLTFENLNDFKKTFHTLKHAQTFLLRIQFISSFYQSN